MNKKLLSIIICFILLILNLTINTAFSQQIKNINGMINWEGTYTFSEDGGKNAAGDGIFVTHEIRILKKGEQLFADIEASGYQTFIELQCRAKIQGNKINWLGSKIAVWG